MCIRDRNHIDIRKEGSGNSGTTNALRVLGWKAGIFTFLGDVLKCVAAYFIVRFMSVSYTHLDVYKRQGLMIIR